MLVEPPIPDSLERILREQEGQDSRVSESRRLIYENPKQYDDHLRLINDSIILIEFISLHRPHQDDDELVLRGIGDSLYNDCATTWLLMMQGFYQISFMPQRHLLECSILLEYFSYKRSAIQEWKEASRALRKRNFFPHRLLKRLKEMSGVEEHPIEASYALLCDMDVHPTYKGIALMLGDSRGVLHWGPFVDPIPLRNGLVWLARISSYAAKQLVVAYGEENLKQTLPDFGVAYNKFNSWHLKWIKLYRDFPTVDALKQEGHDL